MKKREKRFNDYQRAQTGVMQFPNDWPGVFIRGDHAMSLADELHEMGICVTTINGPNLEDLLRSCFGDRTPHPNAQQVTFVEAPPTRPGRRPRDAANARNRRTTQ